LVLSNKKAKSKNAPASKNLAKTQKRQNAAALFGEK